MDPSKSLRSCTAGSDLCSESAGHQPHDSSSPEDQVAVWKRDPPPEDAPTVLPAPRLARQPVQAMDEHGLVGRFY
jgi:hypothetical protein